MHSIYINRNNDTNVILSNTEISIPESSKYSKDSLKEKEKINSYILSMYEKIYTTKAIAESGSNIISHINNSTVITEDYIKNIANWIAESLINLSKFDMGIFIDTLGYFYFRCLSEYETASNEAMDNIKTMMEKIIKPEKIEEE